MGRETPLFVGITGSSGSGKTTVAKKIAQRFSDEKIPCQIISLDNFYRDGLDPKTTNWDHPDAFDHERFLQFLRELKQNGTAKCPQYDFSTCSRKRNADGSEITAEITAANIFVFEGIFAHHQNIIALYDATLFVKTNLNICLARRAERDERERNISKESNQEAWEKNVEPAYHEFIAPKEHASDFVVTNTATNTAVDFNVDELFNDMLSQLFQVNETKEEEPSTRFLFRPSMRYTLLGASFRKESQQDPREPFPTITLTCH